MSLYLQENRRVQKVFWRQLMVLDSMVSLLEGLESSQQLMARARPPQPDGGARGRWKSLKAENRSLMAETEQQLTSLQDKIQQIQERRHKITQLVQQLNMKKQQHNQLEISVQNALSALESCDLQLAKMRAEFEATQGQLLDWQRIRDQLQACVSANQDYIQITLLTLSQSQLCVELRPHPSSYLSSNDLQPLKLSITWSHDDRFKLEVEEHWLGLLQDCVSGRSEDLNATLLEMMQTYVGQAELLSEIQSLRSSFAIDWCPAQRLLVYLKSASQVSQLQVEEGYPSSGSARLLSVRRDGQPVDTKELKPPKPAVRLTDWLVFLCNSPLV